MSSAKSINWYICRLKYIYFNSLVFVIICYAEFWVLSPNRGYSTERKEKTNYTEFSDYQ